MRNSNNITTTNFYLATFLLAKGSELIGIERSNPRRSQFIFANNPHHEKLIEAYNYGTVDAPLVKVDARKLATSIRTLKERLYQDRI